MTIDFSQAVSAYNRAVKQQGLEGIDARDQASGSDFADTLRDARNGRLRLMRSRPASQIADIPGD